MTTELRLFTVTIEHEVVGLGWFLPWQLVTAGGLELRAVGV